MSDSKKDQNKHEFSENQIAKFKKYKSEVILRSSPLFLSIIYEKASTSRHRISNFEKQQLTIKIISLEALRSQMQLIYKKGNACFGKLCNSRSALESFVLFCLDSFSNDEKNINFKLIERTHFTKKDGENFTAISYDYIVYFQRYRTELAKIIIFVGLKPFKMARFIKKHQLTLLKIEPSSIIVKK